MNNKLLKYIKGDITKPFKDSNIVIAHIVNDLGAMGSGVAKALYEKWPSIKSHYHKWHETNYRSNKTTDYCEFVLGNSQSVHIEESNIIIFNMIAQHGTISSNNPTPIRYDALDKCLKEVYEYCKENKMDLHLPKIGSLRSGGFWPKIEQIILDNISVPTYIYEFEEK